MQIDEQDLRNLATADKNERRSDVLFLYKEEEVRLSFSTNLLLPPGSLMSPYYKKWQQKLPSGLTFSSAYFVKLEQSMPYCPELGYLRAQLRLKFPMHVHSNAGLNGYIVIKGLWNAGHPHGELIFFVCPCCYKLLQRAYSSDYYNWRSITGGMNVLKNLHYSMK